MSTQKRCHYEVLNLPKTCTQEEIRSAYKKLALQRHPDKLIRSGVSEQDANSSFQELLNAYEVLSDPKERSWYDSHRSQILYSSSSSSSSGGSTSTFCDLYSYFTPSCYTDYTNEKTGFYKVYGDVFGRVYADEVGFCRKMELSLGLVKEAPLMGDLGSEYSQVNAFYGYWLNFTTVMDFGWVYQWDAKAGVNRKSRRVMEEENKKLRKRAKKEYNEMVRGLAEFVKKRDKRVRDMMEAKAKERERKKEEEMKKRKEMEREKSERARMYEEPEWAKVDEVEEFEGFEEEEEEEEKKNEFYCVACGKKFKSDKQWKNHEQSKKHKDKVAELRKSFVEEEDIEEDEDEDVAEAEEDADDEYHKGVVHQDGFMSAEDGVEELEEKFRDSVGFEERTSKEDDLSEDEDENIHAEELTAIDKSVGADDDLSMLEEMISGRKNRNKGKFEAQTNHMEFKVEEEEESMEYDNKKGKKKSRRAKKERGKNFEAETSNTIASKADDSDTHVPGEESNVPNDSDVLSGANYDDQANSDIQKSTRSRKPSVERKDASQKEISNKSKNSSKGRKQKEKSKSSDPVCEKCGEEFESRNKLYKHINETGHALLKLK